MGFFDKKYCDVCGEKIGLLGNRKLEDGNLCKDCAAKLSPFFSERKFSTVEEVTTKRFPSSSTITFIRSPMIRVARKLAI